MPKPSSGVIRPARPAAGTRSHGARVRRRSSLVLYWEEGRLICHDYLTNEAAEIEPEVVGLLHQLGEPRPAAQIETPPGYGPDRFRQALAGLKELGFVNGRPSQQERSLESWHWRSPARQFLFSTKSAHQPTSRKKRRAYIRTLYKTEAAPSLYKSYPKAKRTPLKKPSSFSTPAADAISRITNTRAYKRSPISLLQLSELLFLACGRRSVIHTPAWGRLLDKTTYSGGNRYPIEVYLVAVSVKSLRPGLYHYNVRDHALELLKPGRFERLVRRIGNEQEWIKDAAVYFLLTGVLRRTMWKYRHDYGLRIVLGDVGHVSQNLYLAATSLDLGSCSTWALNHNLAEKFLGIDGVEETLLCLNMAGRPRGRVPN